MRVRRALSKTIALAMLGALAWSAPLTVDAKRVHDPAVETKVSNERKGTLQERIDAILHPEEQPTTSQTTSTSREEDENTWGDEWTDDVEFTVPVTLSANDSSIIGTPMASQRQCVRYLLRNNPHPNIAVSPEEIVQLYYEEGEREGIRPDVALCQAFKETGFFRYGGTVTPDQNNYCGLGTTSAVVKGSYFPNPQIGVRAHIQHLLAYSSTRRPSTEIVDPRYSIVRKAYGKRTLGNWEDLNGRWAVPGKEYGQQILSMFNAMLLQ